MARPTKDPQLDSDRSRVPFGSPGHEALLAGGYGMTKEDAERIIAERDAKPERWPYEEYKKAKAFLEALAVRKPQPSSSRPGWERTRTP